jgi:hypothetical protein
MYRPGQALRIPRRLRPPDFHDNRHMEVVRLSVLCTGRLYPTGNIPGDRFFYSLSRTQGHSAAGRIMSMKNSNPRPSGRSAVPQPTAPPSAPHPIQNIKFILTVWYRTPNLWSTLIETLKNTLLDRTVIYLHVLVFMFTYLIPLSVFETSTSKYRLLDRKRSTELRLTRSVDTVYTQCEILFCYQNHAGELCVSVNISISRHLTIKSNWPVCVKLTMNSLHSRTAT